jgi:hypothetical protein
VTPKPDEATSLSGEVTHQAALYGVLAKIQDLGLVLTSVNRTEADQGA